MAKRVQISQPRAPVAVADDFVRKVSSRDDVPMKRLTIDIPESLHTRIKIACAANRQKMADAVRALLEAQWPEAA
jgi:hypothetical protein